MYSNAEILSGCSQYVKGTKKKANHNIFVCYVGHITVVPNTSKVLKRKQITTNLNLFILNGSCSQYVKGTKKKANHNIALVHLMFEKVVPNTSKVLKRKQITTLSNKINSVAQLFPIRQRY